MVIRWLGAFRKKGTFQESLSWELNCPFSAVAAEKLKKGKSAIYHAHVGLLVANKAILRRYRSDVYSKYTEKGALVPSRKEGLTDSTHTECFVKPIYKAIVIKGKVQDKVLQACLDTGMTILRLTRDGRLLPHS